MPSEFAELVAALAMFGVVVILPLVFMLLRHQRAIASMIHQQPSEELKRQIEALEAQVRELRAAQNLMLIEDDDRRQLGRAQN